MSVDSTSLGYWCCSAAAAGALMFRLPRLWRDARNPMLWTVCVTLLLAATTTGLSAPMAIAWVNQLFGIANLAAPIVYSLIVCLSAAILIMLLYWRGPAGAGRTARWWLLAYSAVAVAEPVLFSLADTPVERRVDFDTFYARTPYAVEMVLAYLIAFAVATVVVARMCWRWARVAGRPWLRRGLWVIVAGALLGSTFAVTKLTAVVARWWDADLDYLSSGTAPALSSAGLVVTAIGFVLPVAGHHLSRVHAWIRQYQAYRALYPLWNAMRTATPGIVLPVRLPWWDVELRLTRRITEISDGRLALRNHFDPAIDANLFPAGGAALDSESRAVLEAARLRAAIAAKAHNITLPRRRGQGGPDTGS
jgi:hypothetical protein